MSKPDADTLKALTDCFNNLILKPTEKKTDFQTMLRVTFYRDKNIIAAINADRNGVFMVNGNYYEAASGSFDYDFVNKIYIESKYK